MNKKTEITLEISMWLIIVFIIVSVIVLLKSIEIPKEQAVTIKKIEKNIYSLDLQNYKKARFILGCGSIKEELHYFMYIDNGEGKKIFKVPAEMCTLIERNERPKIIYYNYVLENGEMIKSQNIKGYPFIDKEIEIIIPENTIKEKYEVF